MKTTTKRTVTFFLYLLTCVFGILCVLWELSLFFRVCVAILVVISVWQTIRLAYCPNCGSLGKPIRPFQKQEPRCKKCGK